MVKLLSLVVVLFAVQGALLEESPTFYLYTESNLESPPQVITSASVNTTNFNATHPVVFYIFDRKSYLTSDSVIKLRDAYLQHSPTNFIVVDWTYGGDNKFQRAANYTEPVGLAVADLILSLRTTFEGDLSITIVGFGLGAHAAGSAGKKVSPKIGTIVGLDPTEHIYDKKRNLFKRLQMTDAISVQVIHTTNKVGSFKNQLGRSNFYFNYGEKQPGCALEGDQCCHDRAWIYWAESINSGRGFWAEQCENEKELRLKRCDNPELPLKAMGGYEVDPNAMGLFNVRVNKYPPYARGQ